MEAEKSVLKFNNPQVLSVAFNLNPEYKEDSDGMKCKVDLNTQVFKRSKDKKAIVFLDLTINNVENPDDFEPNEPLTCNILMRGDFSWVKDTDENMVDSLLSISAPSLLISYARPILGNLTINAGFPEFQLPFIDMNNNQANIEEEIEEN